MPINNTSLRRILIAEDEPTVAFFLQQMLREYGYAATIDLAESGDHAADKLQLTRYELLITDLNLPAISGLKLAEMARGRWPGIKVILMTAGSMANNRNDLQLLKVNGFLTKPFQMSELRDMIHTIFAAEPSTPGVDTVSPVNTQGVVQHG